MKLKKFAALALAGVMAVSMLAGCSGKSTNTNPSNPGTDDDETEVVPSSAVVNILNSTQPVANDVQVKFTDDAKFEADMNEAIERFGLAIEDTSSVSDKILAAYKNLTGKTFDKEACWSGSAGQWTNEFYDGDPDLEKVKKDNDKTFIMVYHLGTKYVSVEAAVRDFADMLNTNVFEKLVATTLDEQKPGEEYVNYSYTGTACVISAIDKDSNAPVYYFACEITQNATVEKAASV